jgi:hypothetical protein
MENVKAVLRFSELFEVIENPIEFYQDYDFDN